MRIAKEFLTLFLSVSLCFPTILGVKAKECISDVKTLFDAENSKVIFKGKTPYGEGSYVTTEVNAPSDREPFYVGEAVADKEGIFEFTLSLDKENDISGKYVAYFGGGNLDKSQEFDFVFINKNDNSLVLSAMNNATSENIEEKFNSVAEKCGIERGENTIFYNLSDQGKHDVYNSLTKRTFSDGYEVKVLFEQGSLLQSLKESGNVDILIKNSELLGIDVSDGSYYAGLDEIAKERVAENLGKTEFSIRDTEGLKKAFNMSVYVELINSIDNSSRDKLIQYIEECNGKKYTDISLKDYKSSAFSDTDRLNVVKQVLSDRGKKIFTTLDEVDRSFRDSVKFIKSQKVENKKPSPSHGGGGGGGSVSISRNPSVFDKKESLNKIPEGSLKFKDLDTVPWAVRAIEYLADKKIIKGVSENLYEPQRNITREEFVKILVEGLNIPEDTTSKKFADVLENQWYYKYVMTSYANGIVMGINEDLFGINRPITREQLCTMVYRAMELTDMNIESEQIEVNFNDENEISDYAKDAVKSLYRAGVIKGTEGNKFEPTAFATRAMAAKIIYGVLERGHLI